MNKISMKNIKHLFCHIKNKLMLNRLKKYGELVDSVDFSIVTIHPLHDEPLQRKSSNPALQLCDFYWTFNGKFFFVSIYINREANPNITGYLNPYTRDIYNFNIITHQDRIDSDFVNKLLRFLSNWMIENQKALKKDQRTSIFQGEII